MNEPHAPSVVDNELQTVSPTSLEKHERCHRRWHFSKVLNRPDPAGPAASAGTIVHKGIEDFMESGFLETLTPLQKNMIRFAPPAKTLGVRMEVPIDTIGLKVEGIPVIGRIDCINDSGVWYDNEGVEHKMEPNEIEVLDWKTTKSLEYAKTPNQMSNTFQMRMYAKAALELRKVIDRVRVSHGYGQMQRKPEALKVTKVLTVHEIETFWYANIVPAVRLMKHTARQTDFRKVQPNFEACHDFGKRCPFMDECEGDTLSMIIGTSSALPNLNNAANGGNTMSLLSKFNTGGQRAAMQVPESVTAKAMEEARAIAQEFSQENTNKKVEEYKAGMAVLRASVLPPDAPPSDPVLAKAGAEGQFHKNAVGLYVVKDGQWTLAGAKSKADYAALVEGSRTSGGSPAIATVTPITPLTVPTREFSGLSELPIKRGRGRPVGSTKAKKAQLVASTPDINPDPDAPNGIPGTVEASELVSEPTPPASQPAAGILLFVNCVPSISECQGLEGYIEDITSRISSNCNVADIRASEHEALKFGKWKGLVAAAVRNKPPLPGAYRILGRSELYDIVIEALAPMCMLLVRGVGA